MANTPLRIVVEIINNIPNSSLFMRGKNHKVITVRANAKGSITQVPASPGTSTPIRSNPPANPPTRKNEPAPRI
jgi:hypothetical protein